MNALLKDVQAKTAARRMYNELKSKEFIELENISKVVMIKDVQKELGGMWFLNNDITRFNTSAQPFVNLKTKRKGINFKGINKKRIPTWHTHPYTSGWWPTPEDLRVYTKPHLIFTKYGTWVVYKNNSNVSHHPNVQRFATEGLDRFLREMYMEQYEHDPKLFEKKMERCIYEIGRFADAILPYGVILRFFRDTKEAVKYAKSVLRNIS